MAWVDIKDGSTNPAAAISPFAFSLVKGATEGDVLTCQDEKGTAAWAPPAGATSIVVPITAIATGGSIDGISISFSLTKTGQQVVIAMPTTSASQGGVGFVKLPFDIPADFAPSSVYGLGSGESNSINWFQQTFDAEGEPDDYRISDAYMSFDSGTSYSLTFQPQDEDTNYSGSGQLTLYGTSFTYVTDS